MPAASFAELYQYEANLSAGMVAAVGVISGLTSYDLKGDSRKVVPRLECLVENVRRASVQQNFDNDGNAHDCHFACTLKFRLVTRRTGTTDANVAVWVGTIRARMAPSVQAFNGTTLPLYEILMLAESGTTPAVDEEDDTDILEINYGCEFGVPQYAYPPAAP